MPTQQTTVQADTLPPGTRIGRTALRVGDLEAMTTFYRKVVGLGVLHRTDTTSVLGIDETPLLVLERAEEALERHRSGAGLYYNAFRVPSRAALGDALGRIREGWHLGGASDHLVSEALYLTDPEGNGIELYRDYPREEWPIADDGSVRISTESLDFASIEAAAGGAKRAPPGTDVGHVHLEVTSLDAFREFYVDTLGFEVQTTVPAASFVSASGYHHHLGANTWHHRSTPRDGRGLSWFEVVVPEPSVLGAVRARVAATEMAVTEMDDGFAVTDPDGIEVRLRVASGN